MPVKPPEKIYVVDLLPPAGTIKGDVQGKGTPLSFPKPAPAAPKPVAKAPTPPVPHEPVAKPVVHNEGAEPVPTSPPKTEKEKKAEELRDAVRRSMLKTEETPPQPSAAEAGPVGTGDKPPLGTPEGVPGGKGKAGLGASYLAVLGGWFSARLSCRSVTDVEPEELKKLTVRASIGLSPGRNVTSFSISSSGNPAFDGHVRSLLQSIQSQGITVPESPEGDAPPPNINVIFRCNK